MAKKVMFNRVMKKTIHGKEFEIAAKAIDNDGQVELSYNIRRDELFNYHKENQTYVSLLIGAGEHYVDVDMDPWEVKTVISSSEVMTPNDMKVAVTELGDAAIIASLLQSFLKRLYFDGLAKIESGD